MGSGDGRSSWAQVVTARATAEGDQAVRLVVKIVVTLLVAIGIGFTIGLLRPRTILSRDNIQELGRANSEVSEGADSSSSDSR